MICLSSKIMEKIKKAYYKHPILWSFVGIIVVILILVYFALCFLDVWTHHGATTKVPHVIGMELNHGTQVLREADLDVVVADSIYSREKAPGSIVDVVPQPNSIVKAGREVYLTIVAYSAQPITIDRLLIDTSVKQAEAYLRSKGLRVKKEYVPAEYADVVVGIKSGGRNLSLGSQVTVNDVITLEVGKIVAPEPIITVDNPLDAIIDASVNVDDDIEVFSPEED